MSGSALETLAERMDHRTPTPSRLPLSFQRIGLVPITPIRWAIRDILELNSVAMIFGDPGSGKTFATFSMVFAVAQNHEWFGHPVTPGAVLLIVGEGRSGVIRRFHALAIDAGVDLANLPVEISSTSTALTDPAGSDELKSVVAEYVQEHGAPVLIVVDTLARNFGPGDENSTRDMSMAIATCDAIRELTGAAVLLVHHSGHGDKTRGRGSMALRGALDSEYLLERLTGGLIRFSCTKMKDAPRPPPKAFRLESVELGINDDEGRPETSAVLRVADCPPAPAGKVGRGKNQIMALRVLNELVEAQRDRLASGDYPEDQARVLAADWRRKCKLAGIDYRRVHEVTDSLRKAGLVEITNGYVRPAGDMA